jgi:hypothetical protein
MSFQKSTTFENGFAGFTDGLSAVCAATPKTIGKFVMGDHPTRWHRTRTPAPLAYGWIHVPGVKESGTRPATYTHAVVLEYDRALQRNGPDNVNSFYAGAYAIGANIMAAAIDTSNEEAASEDSSGLNLTPAQVALRVGRGDMEATMGIYHADRNVLRESDELFVSMVLPPTPIDEVAERFPDAHWL